MFIFGLTVRAEPGFREAASRVKTAAEMPQAGLTDATVLAGPGWLTLAQGPPQVAQFALLEPISELALKSLQAQGAARWERRVQIGLYRPFIRPIVIEHSSAGAGKWARLPNGWRILTVEASSPGARGVRLHFENVNLPTGGRLVIYDPANPTGASILLEQAEFTTSKELWAPTLFAEQAAVECQLPPGAEPSQARFTISELSHIYSRPDRAQFLKEGACEVDVSCYPDYAKEASGVAMISYVHNGNSYLCSGSLLATTYHTKVEYFLAARHCIGNQELASTIEFLWLFQTDTCNGTPPAPGTVPTTTGGADLLLAGTSDFALLKLRRPAPPGVSYLGWSVTPPVPGETLACIHHPDGTHKRISFGGYIGSDIYFWGVQWNSGVTESGSSGAPLFNSAHKIIGQLGGGFGGPGSSCNNPTAPDQFGRFDVTYTFIKKWIDPSGSGGGPPPKAATYYGLFYDQGGVIPQTSGAFAITTTPRGKFTGKLQMGTAMFPFSGELDANGVGNARLKHLNLSPLTLQFQVNLSQGGDALTGLITDGNWTSLMTGGRPVLNRRTNSAPQAGKYTLIIAADNGAGPGGNSFGTVLVGKTGRLVFIGSLADGTKAMQSSYVSVGGKWPLYIPLYNGQGFLLSQVSFETTDTSDLSGALAWNNSGNNGFSFTATLIGSAYLPPQGKGTSILNITNGVVSLNEAGWGAPMQGNVLLGSKCRLTGQNGFKVTGSFAANCGLFTGSVADPSGKGTLPVYGVALQKRNMAAGFFSGQNQTGTFLLQPAPVADTNAPPSN